MRRKLICCALGVLWLALSCDAWAQQPQAQAQPMSVYRYSFYKTVTYETVVNLADIPLYRVLLGGTAAVTPLFTAVNVVTAAGAYYGHELLWNIYGRSERESPSTALDVGVKKFLLYRVVSTARNLALGYAFTGNATMSVGFALVTNLLDGSVFIANEYAWYVYGPPIKSELNLAAASPTPRTP